MGMRFRLTVLVAALALLAGSAAAPAFVRASVAQVRFVRPAWRDYAGETGCTGVVGQAEKKQVFISTPLIADVVCVRPGDRVREGDTLAEVDTETTRSVLSQSIVVEQEAREEDASLAAQDWEKIEQAAALYGVSMDEVLPLLEGREAQRQIRGVADGAEQTVAVPAAILSPMDGVVTDVAMESGVLTQATGAVFTIAREDRYIVRASVGENQADAVRPGDTAQITVTAVGGRVYSGVVAAIAPTAQRGAANAEATVAVTIEILDPDSRLRDGYSASARITSQDSRTLVSLPYEAVRQDADNQEFVWVYDDGRARKQPVETGEELSNCVEIVSGVWAGDVVLIDAAGRLEQGARVRLGGEGLA